MAVETGHSEVQELGGLLVVDLGRFAGLAAHLHPVGAEAVEGAGAVFPAGRSVGATSRDEGVFGLEAGLFVPDPVEMSLATRTGGGLPAQDGTYDDDRKDGAEETEERQTLPLRFVAEGREQGLHRRKASVGRHLEPAEDRIADLRRYVALCRRWCDLAREYPLPQIQVALAGKRMHAVERLVERDAEGELIAAGVDVKAQVLLWGHVRRCTDNCAGLGEARRAALSLPLVEARVWSVLRQGFVLRVFIGVASDAKVGDPDSAVVTDEHVIWLKVAMHQTHSMGRPKAAGRLAEAVDDLGSGALFSAEPAA